MVADQKEQARLYNESRVAEVAALNESLAADMAELDGLFRSTLTVDDFLDFESLKEVAPRPQSSPAHWLCLHRRLTLLTSGLLSLAGRRRLFRVPNSDTRRGTRPGGDSTMPQFMNIGFWRLSGSVNCSKLERSTSVLSRRSRSG